MSKRSGRIHMRFEERRIIAKGPTWYVVATYDISSTMDDESAADRAADALLRKAGVDVWMPRYWTTIVRGGRKVEVERLFFPGYLFAGVMKPEDPDEHETQVLRSCRYVNAILGIDGPLAIPHPVMEQIALAFSGDVKSERMQAAALYEIGLRMRVAGGPFASFFATVTALLSTGHVKADVDLWNRAIPVVFEPGMLERA